MKSGRSSSISLQYERKKKITDIGASHHTRGVEPANVSVLGHPNNVRDFIVCDLVTKSSIYPAHNHFDDLFIE